MNKLTALIAFVTLIACNQKTDEKQTASAATPADENYAYTLKQPHDYKPGSKENLRAGLAALKAFEMNNIAECVKYFGDTVTVEFDGFEARMPKDSLLDFFTKARGDYKALSIEMSDYESVQTTDNKNEWVSLWYKQHTTDAAGKMDSAEVMNDIKFANGKIVVLNEKMRHYPKK